MKSSVQREKTGWEKTKEGGLEGGKDREREGGENKGRKVQEDNAILTGDKSPNYQTLRTVRTDSAFSVWGRGDHTASHTQ